MNNIEWAIINGRESRVFWYVDGVLQVSIGSRLEDALRDAAEMATSTGEVFAFKFNGDDFTIAPGTDAYAIYTAWLDEQKAKRTAYLKSDEYKQMKAAQRRDEAERRARFDEAMAKAPACMTFCDGGAERYDKWVSANTDPYGAAAVRYGNAWARLMEYEMSTGKSLAECWDDASHVADVEGITGFMHAAASQMLWQCWVHGAELKELQQAGR